MKKLAELFPLPDRSAWRDAAAAEIGGKDPDRELQWPAAGELQFLPLYTAQDALQLTAARRPMVVRVPGLAGERTWSNLPPVLVGTERTANELILEHLRGEAEGVFLSLANRNTDFAALLREVAWEHCTVSFVADPGFPLGQLRDYITASGLKRAQLQGAIFWKDSPPADSLPGPGFRELGLFIAPASPVDEIAESLARGVRTVDAAIAAGASPQNAFAHLAFSLATGADLLVQVSKLRALRQLWYQVARAYGLADYRTGDTFIHARCEVAVPPAFQPHANMLHGTLAALAAVAGGSTAVTVFPEDEANPTMRRIARNVAVILRNESHFDKVNDPFCGAYGTTVMTDALAREAWKKFQLQVPVPYETELR